MGAVEKRHRIFVAGHRGLVGSAIVRRLRALGYSNIVTRTHRELDLCRQQNVEEFFAAEALDCVVLAAARVGGIHANDSQRAEFIRDNLLIQTHVIDAAYRNGVTKLVFLGSSCIYPRDCTQPIREEYLLSGPLERTNEPYAVAKIAGLKMCEAYNAQYGTQYLSLMPTNLYGPGDNFELSTSHVIPALMRKIHSATQSNEPSVTVWGSGSPMREFLHVDDLADACVFLMECEPGFSMLNVGSGEEISIKELAATIARVVGYRGGFEFDTAMPDGTPRKLLDSGRLRSLGWRPRIDLIPGLRDTYRWFVAHGEGGGSH